MYKPIVEGDSDKVSALYGLFKRVYLIIGGIIAVCGCLVMPLLPYLAKDYQAMDVNLYLTFGLMLISVVLTYAFSAKISLINAYKNNYITTTINSGGNCCNMDCKSLFYCARSRLYGILSAASLRLPYSGCDGSSCTHQI